MRARNAILALVVMLAAGAWLQGCGDSNAKVLADAVYAKNVPVYKGAKYSEQSGSESWGDEPGSYTKGSVWWFETKATKDELFSYYHGLYPNAERIDLDDGAIELRWVPEGATRFEDVEIVMADHELRIGEDVTPDALARKKNGGTEAASHAGD